MAGSWWKLGILDGTCVGVHISRQIEIRHPLVLAKGIGNTVSSAIDGPQKEPDVGYGKFSPELAMFKRQMTG
jgi:hypothetical protein